MGKTFRCWLIANFEIIMYVLLLIISAILLFGTLDLEIAFAFKLFVYSALIAGMLSLPTNRGSIQFGKYLFLVGFGILMTIGVTIGAKNDPEYANSVMLSPIINKFWTVFIIASVISVFVAVYTYINIDEVLSRRMLWRNSNVSIFEYSLLYTLDRFCNISLSIVVSTFWLWSLIALIKYI
ncbi:MAG: hypothetical protein LBM07_04515 [Culturomica sp.]|jgi:hypothetical protein|nr:hypothetical protein [Culturomica sp.]